MKRETDSRNCVVLNKKDIDRIRSIVEKQKHQTDKPSESLEQPRSCKAKVDIRPSRYIKQSVKKNKQKQDIPRSSSKIPKRVESGKTEPAEEPPLSPETVSTYDHTEEEETEIQKMIKNQRRVLNEIEFKTEMFQQIQDDEKMKRSREKIYQLAHQAEQLREKRRQDFQEVHTSAEDPFKMSTNKRRFIADTEEDHAERELTMSVLQNIVSDFPWQTAYAKNLS